MSRMILTLAILAFPLWGNAQDVDAVLKRDFHARGQATMDRVVQDRLQKVCTEAHDNPPADGSCYNCHRLSPSELSYGTIGPSLTGFGKQRGTGEEVQRYVYGKIYNAKAYNACSQMPRLCFSGTLT